jgi:murein DD-endopeptidase MepM/ murein hydrolase activator NlpD
VVATGWSGFGNYILIAHDVYGYTFYSVYAHVGVDRDFNTGILVTPGDFVSTDTPIGVVGNSIGGFPFEGGKDNKGNLNTISIHLHFEVRTSANVDLAQSDPFADKRYWAFGPGWSNDFVDLTLRYGRASNLQNKMLPPP